MKIKQSLQSPRPLSAPMRSLDHSAAQHACLSEQLSWRQKFAFGGSPKVIGLEMLKANAKWKRKKTIRGSPIYSVKRDLMLSRHSEKKFGKL